MSTVGTGITVKYKVYRWMSDGITGYADSTNYVEAGTNIDHAIQIDAPNKNLTPFKEYYYMVTGLGTPECFSVTKGGISGNIEITLNIVSNVDGYILLRSTNISTGYTQVP